MSLLRPVWAAAVLGRGRCWTSAGPAPGACAAAEAPRPRRRRGWGRCLLSLTAFAVGTQVCFLERAQLPEAAPVSTSRPAPSGAAPRAVSCGGWVSDRPAEVKRGALRAALLLALSTVWAACATAALSQQGPVTSDPKMKSENLRGILKKRTRFPDFELSNSGLQVKTLVAGKADAPVARQGDVVVVDWEGYTINYFGRPFQTRKLIDQEKIQVDPFRFKIGDGTVIPGIDEAVRGMSEGGIRQLIVPVELGYDSDKKLMPRPSTFSGQRALDFVIDNQGGLMDKTLLFNISVKRVYQN